MKWYSSNTNVARANASGLITGVSAGSASITVKVGGKTASKSITVTASDIIDTADLGTELSLRKVYNENPGNDVLLENMYNVLSAIGEKAEANKVLDDVLAKDPNNFVALADKGIAAMGEEKADEAITWFEKAIASKPDNAAVHTYLGICLCVKAQDMDDKKQKAAKKELFGKAIKAFDKAKELDPKRELANWGYNRYSAYYNYYGPDAPETKQAENDYKN